MSVELNIGAIEIRDGDNMKPIGVIGSGGSLDTSEIQELLDSKTSKTRIDFDGNRTFKIGTKTLNYKELHDVHLAQQDFAFVVYGDRAYLLSYVQDDASSMRELRFQSVIATTDSNGVSNTKTSGIYVKSSDGINIASVTVTDINSENNSYKASAINDTNKNNVWYPSNKAVADYVDSSVAELNDDLSTLSESIVEISEETSIDLSNKKMVAEVYINVDESRIGKDTQSIGFLYIPCMKNTKYTVRKSAISNVFRVATSIATPANGVSVLNAIDGGDKGEIDITTTAASEYLAIQFAKTGDDVDKVLNSISVVIKNGAKDTVARKMIDLMDKKLSEVDKIVIDSSNVFNPDASTVGYWSLNGLQTSASYTAWFASEKIEIDGSVIQSNIPLNSVVFFKTDGSIDRTNSIALLNSNISTPINVPQGVTHFAVSAKNTYLEGNIMINFGDALLPYSEYGSHSLDENLLKLNYKKAKICSDVTSEFLTNFKQAISKNLVVSYSANFDSFTSLKVGFTGGNDFVASHTDYFEITDTNFILHRKGSADINWEHGLTIERFIGVSITFDFEKKFDVTVTTIGGTYTKSNYIHLGKSYYPFAVIDGTNVKNNRLSASCKDFGKSIYLFGDSYLSCDSSRWIKYFVNQDGVLINQYAGESSTSAIEDFRTLIKYGKPKFVVWCLGMNDRTDSDEDTPSSYWLPYVNEVISTCEANNIVPILVTIPNVPTINHDGKNKWVRNSGYHYIDFASAVNSDANGNWFGGLLASDGIHPTANGARVLCSKAITDFADLLITD